jgi:hypothetical protein
MDKPPEIPAIPVAQPTGEPRRSRTPVYIAAAIISIGAILVHVGSYWWSPSITLWDVCLTCDDGLVSLEVPLTRLTATGKPTSNFLLYTREGGWMAGMAGKTPLRAWMAELNNHRCEGAMLADFGYWKGAWLCDARPGPFIVVFVPVWLAAVVAFGIFLAIYYRLLRFRLRSLFVLTALCAVIFWLLILRAPAE